jgi:hypothetical protein
MHGALFQTFKAAPAGWLFHQDVSRLARHAAAFAVDYGDEMKHCQCCRFLSVETPRTRVGDKDGFVSSPWQHIINAR